jgi:hypothetical protein
MLSDRFFSRRIALAAVTVALGFAGAAGHATVDAPGASAATVSATSQSSSASTVATGWHRRCWWRNGRRYCRWY